MLNQLFQALEDVFDDALEIEQAARTALNKARLSGKLPQLAQGADPLPVSIMEVMQRSDAHQACQLITQLPFIWTPPTTSSDPLYIEHSLPKVHVELIGPDGLVPSDEFRIGLYGMRPRAEYGIRTHPAEEVFIMLAGEVDWIRGDAPYAPHGPGTRSYHPSMLPHANRTRDEAFMSIYVWRGDVSTVGYKYKGGTN